MSLDVGAADISGKANRSSTKLTLSRIAVKDRGGTGTTELTDDCGTAMHEVMGSQHHGDEGRAAIKHGRNETYTSKRTYQGGYGGAPNNTTPELWFQEILAKEFGAGKTPAELYQLYKDLDATARAQFDKKYGVNDQAVPKVGQGITTFSQFDYPGWQKIPGSAFTWNFHYATNILTSGSDYLTLENYAGHGTTNWFMDMIGPASKGSRSTRCTVAATSSAPSGDPWWWRPHTRSGARSQRQGRISSRILCTGARTIRHIQAT